MNIPSSLHRVAVSLWLFAGLCAVGLPVGAHASDYVSLITNTPNLVGYWRFDPVDQTNSLVNGYQGALEGNAQIGPPGSGYPLPADATNQALELDGSSSYLLTTLYGMITNEASVIVWVNLAAEPSAAGHFFQVTAQSQSSDDFDFQIQTDDSLHFYTDSGSSTVYATPIPTNQWHFLAATFVANGDRPIYLDGVSVANSTAGNHSLNTGSPCVVGDNLVFGGRFFEGRISEVAVFNRALTATEIATIYQAGAPAYLSLASQPGGVVLSWSTNYAAYLLQTNNNLGNPAGWGVSALPYAIVGDLYTASDTNAAPQMFYRLVNP